MTVAALIGLGLELAELNGVPLLLVAHSVATAAGARLAIAVSDDDNDDALPVH